MTRLNAWQQFVKDNNRPGLTLKDLSKMYKAGAKSPRAQKHYEVGSGGFRRAGESASIGRSASPVRRPAPRRKARKARKAPTRHFGYDQQPPVKHRARAPELEYDDEYRLAVAEGQFPDY